VGRPVGSLAAAVVAVRATGGAVETLPDGERTVAAGETVYVVGRPDAVRRLTATDGVAAAPSPSDD
jgi:Trk K+ transport system NAD-binding subunit